jgi:hypothetical protein
MITGLYAALVCIKQANTNDLDSPALTRTTQNKVAGQANNEKNNDLKVKEGKLPRTTLLCNYTR